MLFGLGACALMLLSVFYPAGSLQLHKSGFRCIEVDGCTNESGKIGGSCPVLCDFLSVITY